MNCADIRSQALFFAHARKKRFICGVSHGVAKGLAIESVRRFYIEGQGDIRAVTYNPLCLALRPDDGELEVRRARPMIPELASGTGSETDDGVLLPSSRAALGDCSTDRSCGRCA
jgi:hypothetical protein